MGDRDGGEVRYRAFLSYSHRDAAAAGRLHRRLEAYRIPRRLIGRETPAGPVPARLWPIFRDREELPAAADLSETVRAALAQSGALIILCSPHAVGSLWVEEEIRVFRELHPDRPILAAILDGDPPDCFPPLLRAYRGEGHEPLATDLRRHRDGERLGLLKLVAGITGLGLDDLVQRDASRRVRRVMAVTAGAVAAMLVMAVMALIALNSSREAARQQAEAEGLVEFMLTDLRQDLKDVGRLDIMTRLNQRAMAYYGAQGRLENLSDESLERRARVIGVMGEDDENAGDLRGARARYEALHRTTETLLENDPNNPERILAHAASENRLALLAVRSNPPEAAAGFRSARRLLASIADWGQNHPGWLRLAAYAEGNIGVIMLRLGEDKAAVLEHCRRAVHHSERLATLRPGDASASYDLVFHLFWLGEALRASGHVEPWRRTQAAYLMLMRSLYHRHPRNVQLGEQRMEIYVSLAETLRARGERQSARRYLTAARDLSQWLVRHDRRNAVWAGYERRLAESLAGRH
ncbi:MAG TPA: toll/interleukin-1 receptor domain-containing protein [Allosphingosinicella sp.]|nr:toll/interleukin-1 receptor domain-containing protein [Allosphingosinicella sp.]